MNNQVVDSKFLEKVRKRFEDLSNTTGREYKLNEFELDKWTLRDFIAEAHYEMTMRKHDLYDQSDKNEYNRYVRFVNAYKDLLTDDIKCYETHADPKYDLVENKATSNINKEKLEEATIKALIECKDNKVDQLINSLLDEVPDNYSYGLFFDNRWEYILNDLRKQKRSWNKQLKYKDDSKYSTSFIETNLDIINKAINKVQKLKKG